MSRYGGHLPASTTFHVSKNPASQRLYRICVSYKKLSVQSHAKRQFNVS